ncbi:MAG: hypothetical protein K2X44_00815 [Magnetospirillum sp.]|nr:hypothetical protein [Magnetospirillum sp.]
MGQGFDFSQEGVAAERSADGFGLAQPVGIRGHHDQVDMVGPTSISALSPESVTGTVDCFNVAPWLPIHYLLQKGSEKKS